ncbi:MAG: hypothetical protein ACYDH6_23365 [Acidimicrobiales bacterium]
MSLRATCWIMAISAIVVVSGGATASASGPSGSIQPSIGLVNNQLVTIRAVGFSPSTRIQVLECSGTAARPPKDNHSCQGLTLDTSGVTDPSGAYLNSPADPTQATRGYRIRTLPVALDLLGIHCGPHDACGVYVGPQEGDFTRPHLFLPFSFAGAPGGGSSFPWWVVGVLAALAVAVAAALRRRRVVRSRTVDAR